jgi:hypothetical protein
MFLNLAEQLLAEGKLDGTITGGKQLAKAVYVPNAYARAQVSILRILDKLTTYITVNKLSCL